MNAIHDPCSRYLEVSVHWPHKAPFFYVFGQARMTCPVCRGFLTFETLRPVQPLNDLTPEEQKVWFENVDPIPF